jgi:hypothetical protein
VVSMRFPRGRKGFAPAGDNAATATPHRRNSKPTVTPTLDSAPPRDDKHPCGKQPRCHKNKPHRPPGNQKHVVFLSKISGPPINHTGEPRRTPPHVTHIHHPTPPHTTAPHPTPPHTTTSHHIAPPRSSYPIGNRTQLERQSRELFREGGGRGRLPFGWGGRTGMQIDPTGGEAVAEGGGRGDATHRRDEGCLASPIIIVRKSGGVY